MALSIIARNANHIIQLEQSISDSKLKTVILRSVSHELRTPINVITFITEDLMENFIGQDIKLIQEKLRMASVSAKLLLTLVNDLLDYSRMLAGVFSIQKSDFDLRELVSNTVELISIQANKKNIHVSHHIDPLLPKYIFSDPLRLSQVLLNLLSNALKFTLRGSIEVICISTVSNRMKVMVKDTGLGIENVKLNTLFHEFSSSISPNINPQGCGLGLFISNMIIKELGRKSLDVESKLNVGSTFAFSVDISEDHLNSNRVISETKLFGSHDEIDIPNVEHLNTIAEKSTYRQVMIADDNDFNRIIVASLLSKNGITFSEACTGKEAIDKIIFQDSKGKPYKAVIMDGDMPELCGWEATKLLVELKKEGKLSYLPAIIGYSAYTSDEDIKRCIESGMKQCLTKPCRADLLLSTILKYTN